MINPVHISELRNQFFSLGDKGLRLKYLNYLMGDPESGSRDGKNSDPGSGMAGSATHCSYT
jgi:hypothetical protein